MTLFQLLTEGIHALEISGNPDAKQDANQLLLSAFRIDMVHFLLNRMQEMPEDDAYQSSTAQFRQMIARRGEHYPLQQILGCQEFMGLAFMVNQHVLTPRQDTETLVELVLAEQKNPHADILDLCTGTGCIAISLSRKGGYRQVVATDISEETLRVADKNIIALFGPREGEPGALFPHCYKRVSEDDAQAELRMWLLQGDLFGALQSSLPWKTAQKPPALFDVITSNPPYIPTAEIAGLQPEVRDYEPILALDGAEDGLHYYRKIAAEAKQYLKEDGALYLEIGYDQGEAVRALLEAYHYREIRVCKDLPGNDRVVCARN